MSRRIEGPDPPGMHITSTKRIVAALLALAVSGGLAACQPTGHPRCDALLAPVAVAESLGYRVRCDASFPGESSAGRSVLGWTDHKTRTIWMWPDKMKDERVLRKVAWHEVGHVMWTRQGRHGTQAEEERWADGFSYCADPIRGVGYTVRPGDCRGYR